MQGIRRYDMDMYFEKKIPVTRVGYAFVPDQRMERVYSPADALKNGTVFPELNITLEEYERGLYNGK